MSTVKRMSTSTEGELHEAIDAVTLAVRSGRLVVLPTDTVYGIAADAFSARLRLVVTMTVQEFGSCSQRASASAATQAGFAVSSAMMTTSLGPASMSIPTEPPA